MTAVESPTLRLGGRRFPIVLPSLRDARLHTAAVILTVHTIGITALGFRVSVPQIVSAILAAAVVDVLFTIRLTGKLVWPASGMLTGSGVALILRLVEMQAADYWAWNGWYIYAGVAGVSVMTKYSIRWRGNHLFNPSNFGLVAAFLIIGSTVVEPLDFWWAPLDGWMLVAYMIILGGGILITRRLALLEMVIVFWVVLAVGLGILASAGHCMIATWSPEPVCATRFWWALVTSPEILIFQLFMITDPRTIPRGRWARVVFAGALGLLATLLIAPQAQEYGAKVGLLASLVVLSPVRAAFDHRFPAIHRSKPVSSRTAFLQGVGIGFALAVLSFGIVLAGVPAREGARAVSIAPAAEVIFDIDPATLPPVTVEPGAAALNIDIDPAELAVTLAENLAIEGEAMRRGDGSLLAGAATGERLVEMQRQVDDAISTGRRMVSEYIFDSLVLDLAEAGEGQSSAALSFEAAGTERTLTFDALGNRLSRTESDFTSVFVLRRVGGDRWLIASAGS